MAAWSELDPHMHVPVAAPVNWKRFSQAAANHVVHKHCLWSWEDWGGLRHWAGCCALAPNLHLAWDSFPCNPPLGYIQCGRPLALLYLPLCYNLPLGHIQPLEPLGNPIWVDVGAFPLQMTLSIRVDMGKAPIRFYNQLSLGEPD